MMVRINTVFQEDLIEEIDRIAKEEGKSRSLILREAALQLIKEYQRQKSEEIRMKKVGQAISIQDRLRKKSGKWDSTSELRKWREKHS
ncbi:MAG: ribbon-helix-helix protein, CopG family [Deltaproteobacteria bacterium]|nr:ribbon-helix-helix protein, CopG family [Deltaproteobacteria bacterium]